MNELVLVVNREPGKIDWNFEEINKALDEYLAVYDGMMVQADDVKAAKDVRATLNRIEKQIDDRRKLEKKEFLKPYELFESQAKAVTAKISKVSGAIDKQVKAFEEQEKKAKFEEIVAFWQTECKTTPSITADRVITPKMLNRSTSKAAWQKELHAKHDEIESNLESIKRLEDAGKRDYILAEYLRTLDIGQSLKAYADYQDTLAKAEEYRKQAEAEAQETIKRLSEPVKQVPTGRNDEAGQIIHEGYKIESSQVYHRVLEVWGTRDQIIALANFMNSNGIKFRKAGGK